MRDYRVSVYISDYEWIQRMSDGVEWDESEIVQALIDYWKDTIGESWQAFWREINDNSGRYTSG